MAYFTKVLHDCLKPIQIDHLLGWTFLIGKKVKQRLDVGMAGGLNFILDKLKLVIFICFIKNVNYISLSKLN